MSSSSSQRQVRLSPTAIFSCSLPAPNPAATTVGATSSVSPAPVSAQEPPVTPKSHRQQRQLGTQANSARKKLYNNNAGTDGTPKQRPKQHRQSPLVFTNTGRGNQHQSPQLKPTGFFDSFSIVYATPPRQQHSHLLRRQQSASASLTLAYNAGGNGRYAANYGSNFMPQFINQQQQYGSGYYSAGHRAMSSIARFTPPQGESEMSAIFAGSKIFDSPSAKSLPLPPTQWLEGLSISSSCLAAANPKQLKHVAEEEDSSDDTGVIFDLDHSNDSEESLNAGHDEPLFSSGSSSEECCPGKAAAAKGDTAASPPAPSAPSSYQDRLVESGSGIRLHPLQLIEVVSAAT